MSTIALDPEAAPDQRGDESTLDRFDRRRPFGAWLHRIVANRSLDWQRARSRRAEVVDDGRREDPAERD